MQTFLKYKYIVRIVTGCRSRDSCRDLFKNLKIPPLPAQYILSLVLFVATTKNKFKLNSDVYNVNHSFIHLVVCLTTGPKPLPKRALHIVRSRASSFK